MKAEFQGEEVKLPPMLAHIMWAVFGVSGFFLVSSNGQVPEQPVLMVVEIMFWGVFSGFAWYGVICTIRDVRKGRTLRGSIREFKKTINEAFEKRPKKK